MKRSNKRRRSHRTAQSPGFLAWMLLLLAWLIVLPAAAALGHAVLQESGAETRESPTEELQTPSPAPKAPLTLAASYRAVPALCSLRRESPTILIYHTHTTEAYTMTDENRYTESGAWRTHDNTRNVVAVGEALKDILETQYGFTVIHDTTDLEPPKLATAYERSLATMQTYHEQYPSIVLFLDLHRDAYNAAEAPTDYLTINGTETAKLMFVVGRGDKYEDKPYFSSNYRIASSVTEYLKTIDPKLARPIREKPGRYNQHVAPNCLLVEVGHNANTLEQAIAAMPYLAEGIAYAFAQSPELSSALVPN